MSFQRGQIFQINTIDATVNPPLYTLIDLLKDPLSGHYYREQLTKAPNINYKKNFFEIEKVISTKYFNKKKYFYVKFLYYPPKFNDYVLASDIKISSNN